MISYNKNILICILLLPCFVTAQQDTTVQSYTELFRTQYDLYSVSPLSQPLLKTRNYGHVQLGYRSVSGDFRQAQAPMEQQDISFYAEGTKQIKKFLVTGSFGWYNTKTDSQAYTLRQDYLDPIPYYYYAARPGNWQTIRYKLQGAASVPLLKEKFTVGAGASYNSFNAWRSNDPRPQEFSFDLSASATAHYKIFPKHTIGVAGGLIKKEYDNTWEFRNENNVHVPDMKVSIHNGYGNVMPLIAIKSGFISQATKGFTAAGIYEGEFSFGTLTLKGGYEQTETTLYNNPKSRDEIKLVFGTFDDDIYTASANWFLSNNRNQFNVSFDFYDELGRDFNTDLAANNYIYYVQQGKLHALWGRLKENGKMKYELGARFSLEDRLKKDGNVAQTAEYQIMQTGISGAWYFYIPANRSVLKAALAIDYRDPIHAEAATANQPSAFSDGVVYRDYYYFNAKSTCIEADLLYQVPVKNVNGFVRVQGNYTNASIPGIQPGLVASSLPGNNRLQWQCSIGVNL